jgi:hypothetical protein
VRALTLVLVFGAGLVTSRALEKDAQAERPPVASAVFVPNGGLAFRTLDGRVIAKLAYDAKGGFLELYDEHERPAATLHGNGLSGVMGVTGVTGVTGAAPVSPPPLQPGQGSSIVDLGY